MAGLSKFWFFFLLWEDRKKEKNQRFLRRYARLISLAGVLAGGGALLVLGTPFSLGLFCVALLGYALVRYLTEN
jgi:hypothetical protein